ncbi:arf-GAP with SH3 domain, ANK repeat and PH domain-containing protein 1 isoform X16 [Ochotona curzoniae]|uniref:arf-GAP with SH3 domain, ANK repeat and PH domain-containing protein 1 isoform X16 n=1 Tax=Ochotona curzoniae TaxID=130825 RepID=UPI001B352AE8|nr:arf-GAP with SH3 domain, ANK repeat and PH domain-containing protein 1 isoform X16 [Ochotona curzoniae]
MPDQISVSEFIAETTEDYNSPTTSSFTTRLHNCRNTVTLLEERNKYTLRRKWTPAEQSSLSGTP